MAHNKYLKCYPSCYTISNIMYKVCSINETDTHPMHLHRINISGRRELATEEDFEFEDLV